MLEEQLKKKKNKFDVFQFVFLFFFPILGFSKNPSREKQKTTKFSVFQGFVVFFSFFFGKVFCDFEIFKKPSKKNNTKRNNILCFPGICFFSFFQFLDLFFFVFFCKVFCDFGIFKKPI